MTTTHEGQACGYCRRPRGPAGPGSCACIPAWFWDVPEVRQAVDDRDPSALIRLLREHTDLSQTALARMADISQSLVSGIISGKTSIKRIDKVRGALEGLGAPAADPNGHSMVSPSDDRTPTASGQLVPFLATPALMLNDEGKYPFHSAEGHDVAAPMMLKDQVETAMNDRRRFLALTGALLASTVTGINVTGLDSLIPARHPGAYDLTVLTWLEEELPRLRRMDDHVAGEGLRQVVLGQLRIAADLLHQAPTNNDNEQRLLTVIAHLAQLGGWLSFDEGWHAAAQRLLAISLSTAHAATDPGLTANALASMSFQSALTAQPWDGVQLALTGLGHAAHQPHLVQAMLATRLARAYARTGDAAGCGRALNQAERHLEAADGQSAPPWIYYFDESELRAQAGACWLDLEQPHRALQDLKEAIDCLGTDYIRDGAIYRVRAATAHLQAGDIEQSCTVLIEAAEYGHRAKASRPLADLYYLHARLDPRNGRVRELTERLHDIAGQP